jgi:sulfate transport system permease protein
LAESGTVSWRFHDRSVIPGFGLTLGLTLTWIALIVLIPLCALALKAASLNWEEITRIILARRTLSALELSFGLAFIAATINAFMGLALAWALTRYDFPGRRLADAIVDIPFALPTAVAGISLASIYSQNGWIGRLLSPLGVQVNGTPLGILIALIFVGLPFAVRTVQPVLTDLDPELEQAAANLGASRWQTAIRVILPILLPAILTGFTLAFARAIGEYGSVIFIAGNVPNFSEIAPQLIVIKLEEFRYGDAAAIAAVMLAASFILLFAVNRLQRWMELRG